MQVKIKIAGVDVSGSVDEKALKIESIITYRIDTCGLIVAETQVNEKEEIIISNMAETVRYFAGYIANVDKKLEGITKIFVCDAQDYTVLLNTALVNKIYEDKTDKQIIQDMFTAYLPEIDTTTYIQDGLTNIRLVFNRVSLRQALETIAKNSGYDWYVDYNKKLHYFSVETNQAPFGLSDNPDNATSFPYSRLDYKRDATKIINKVTVVGGAYWSDDTSFELAANGQVTELLLPYSIHKPTTSSSLLVYKNIGDDTTPNWQAQTVGTDYIHSLDDYNCLHNYFEKLLKFASAPPNLKRAVKVIGRYNVPILVKARSEASYNTYGRWFEEKVVNKDIDSRDWAKIEARAILAKHAFVKESGSLVCEEDGLTSGQQVKITNALRGIDGYYLINKITTSILGGTHCQYKVEFGEYNPDLVDMLLDIKARAIQYQATREDEVLTELFEQIEALALTESTDRHEDAFPPDVSRWIALPPDQSVGHHIRHEALALAETSSRWEQAKGQYCYAPKSNGAGLREGKYEFATYG